MRAVDAPHPSVSEHAVDDVPAERVARAQWHAPCIARRGRLRRHRAPAVAHLLGGIGALHQAPLSHRYADLAGESLRALKKKATRIMNRRPRPSSSLAISAASLVALGVLSNGCSGASAPDEAASTASDLIIDTPCPNGDDCTTTATSLGSPLTGCGSPQLLTQTGLTPATYMFASCFLQRGGGRRVGQEPSGVVECGHLAQGPRTNRGRPGLPRLRDVPSAGPDRPSGRLQLVGRVRGGEQHRPRRPAQPAVHALVLLRPEPSAQPRRSARRLLLGCVLRRDAGYRRHEGRHQLLAVHRWSMLGGRGLCSGRAARGALRIRLFLHDDDPGHKFVGGGCSMTCLQ